MPNTNIKKLIVSSKTEKRKQVNKMTSEATNWLCMAKHTGFKILTANFEVLL